MLTLDLSKLQNAPPILLKITNLISKEVCNTKLLDQAGALAWCLDVFNGGECPSDGRSIWLTKLSLFCNERGVSKQELLNWALGHSPLITHGEKRITSNITGNYKRHHHAHGSLTYNPSHRVGNYAPAANSTQKAGWNPDETSSEPLHPPFTDTPCIPESVYAALPVLLRQAVAPFGEGREQDVMLTGTLAVLSGCFPALSGVYDGTDYGANIFVFIVGPPGSGKGTLVWARTLAAPAHAARVAESKRAKNEYEAALADYLATKRVAAKGIPIPPAPTEPTSKMIFIPANNSAANILKMLHENEGQGIICETEADTLSASLKQDWGNFSDTLRKTFHHEPVSSSRKTNSEYLEVERPCLSIAMTGTPGQVVGLIPNGENGLFSRVLFYCYNPHIDWRDVGPGGGRGQLNDYFADLGRQIHDLMNHISVSNSLNNSKLQVELDAKQWNRLNDAGRRWLVEGQKLIASNGATGVVFRLGLSMFRITMLLTLLRTAERGKVPAGRLRATDDDLNTALALGDVYLAHSLALLARMPRPRTGLVPPRDNLADKAEKEKRVKELHAQGMSLRDIAQQVGISKSSVERWVK